MTHPQVLPPSHPRPEPGRTIAIVGAGFCGVATVVQLMKRCASGTTVVLINESGRMARGLAYGTRSPAHLLNVPAGNMSALPDDADHFLRYCRTEAPELQSGAFVPRQCYGDYLESLLDALETSVGDGPRLQRIVGRVASVVPPGSASGQAAIRFDDGQALAADDVVLAFGHFAPRSPLSAQDRAVAGTAYIHDPWRNDALADVGADDPVVLIGAGLTAMDVALALNRQRHVGPIVSVSRHGLLPVAHREGGSGPPVAIHTDIRTGSTLRELLAALRVEARSRSSAGLDWRDLMSALRSRTPQLWGALSAVDRGRFLRHVRPYWEVLRHRSAPQAYREHQQLVQDGRLERLAGRVDHVRFDDGALRVAIRPRGGGPVIVRPARVIVNCTGPTTDIRASGSLLVEQLLADGFVNADPLGLGLHVGSDYRVVAGDGSIVPWLRYVGPLLKADRWEATAVPELREHAANLASALSAPRIDG